MQKQIMWILGLAIALYGWGCGSGETISPNNTGGGGSTSTADGTVTSGSTASATTTASSTASGTGGAGGLIPAIVISPVDYYWGPETGSPILRLNMDTESLGELKIRVCKAFGSFQNGQFDLSLISYDPGTKAKKVVAVFTQIGVDLQSDNCLNSISLPNTMIGLEAGQWLKLKLTSPSGQVFDDCAHEGCIESDNTYDTTVRMVVSNDSAWIVISPDHYYWGPETGSPILRLDTNTKNVGELKVRACKGFGNFQNGQFDLSLISYDPGTKTKKIVTDFTQVGIDLQDNTCTNWVSLPNTMTGLEAGQWLKLKLTSPSGQVFDDCAHDGCMQPDNTYDTTSRRVTSNN